MMIALVIMVAVMVAGFGAVFFQLSKFKPVSSDDGQLRKDLNEALAGVEHRLKGDLALNRREQAEALKGVGDSLDRRLMALGNMQRANLEQVAKSNEEKLERVRSVVENRLQLMQKDNNEKLEVMRATVDEKLHATLEKRLGESFKQVSDRLESVHKGLGEMQTLAAGVGDLKKVLTNVKTRGTWGEVQLGNLLEQIMTSSQYEKNVAVKKRSAERVEFAIKLPNGPDEQTPLWLPIDAKFPVEDYQRLVSAREAGEQAQIDLAGKELVARIKNEAKDIRDKYIAPPETTDFGILYLPTEGLYAEITQRPGLQEQLQRDYRVMVAGPNTVAALLNSLQMGFRTLAIEKRSSEVWQILGSVKTEFGRFGDLLDKTHKKLQEASNTIESAATKSRTIERKLDKVQDLPAGVLPVEPVALVQSVLDVEEQE
ncbi:MAG TPA: DNA recombination protein RmuC [Candidatus Saccharimonadia bacterium]|jgi:DNA recombination protein RmuC|nr:DNA recombination protein RmuC [Candidatus Saccharimonadia bacterium]